MPPRELIVAGFHRSGTSFVMSLLNRAGLHAGDDLIGAFPSNPYGHFEDREVVRFHDALLGDNATSWLIDEPIVPVVSELRWSQLRSIVADRRSRNETWGFKDPRVCVFLPLWKHVMPQAKVLVVYRPWHETAASLRKRHLDGLERGVGDMAAHRRILDQPMLAPRMWATYNEACLAAAQRHPRDVAVVSFAALTNGFDVVELINDTWQFDLVDVASDEVFDKSLPSRPTEMPPVTDPQLAARLDRVYSKLVSLDVSVTHGLPSHHG